MFNRKNTNTATNGNVVSISTLKTQRATAFATAQFAYETLKGMNSRRGYADYEDQQDKWELAVSKLEALDAKIAAIGK